MTDARPILVAPDSFKGTLTARDVAEAVAGGIEAAGRTARCCPVADGGEGTREVLVATLGGEMVEAAAHDPLGREIAAELALLDGGRRAVVETATASGLALVAEGDRDPEAASTQGAGELIAAAVEAGAGEVLVAVGGSATTDGGAGAIEAIESAGGLGDARLTVLCDVRTPFESAARVYAPQKGADADAVRRLTHRLARRALALPRDPRGRAMTGAAGGLSGALWAAFDARLVAGAVFVLDAIGFDARARAAAAVVTAEGRLDAQTLEGKAVSEVAIRCRQGGVPCHAVTGRNALERFDQRVLDLETVQEAGDAAELRAAGERLVQRLAAAGDR